MEIVRCGRCQRKLAEAQYLRLEIKCPRCGTMNILRAERPTPERPGASNVESNYDQDQKRQDAP
ncbi:MULTISPECIES: Com family DNA-binding transcriptional regulator [Comamonadaceae]|uniref:Com family DNA-binding transcriptional regulator n=1 Tax=Rhodoferax aquaticus TaxID=2527691 RepID=A0A515EKG6_9BURK|nr:MULTISPECIES: Com family DNA-binding transcriptional regulator [Comamonadaceae]QDL53151.1 Com family DNA-binding transcriptional regulator [Rhodoferax aquaticus]